MTAKVKTTGGKTSPKGYVLLIIFFWLVTIIYLGADNIIQQKGQELEAVKEELRYIKSENDQLRLDIARLSTPERIEEVAKNVLGMVEVGSEDKVYYITE